MTSSSSHRLRSGAALIFALCASGGHGETAREEAAAFAMFRECADKIVERAYHPETRAEICSRALHGLVSQLAGAAVKGHDRDLAGMKDDAALVEFEKEMRAIAALPGQRHTLRELVELAISAWCKQHDPYTAYVSSEDFRLMTLTSTNKSSIGGIGMTVREKAGDFFCFPFPGSPAEATGIKPGDRLLSVEGKPVDGRSQEFIASLIRGAPGTNVRLRIEHSFGRAQSLIVGREELPNSTVRIERRSTGTSIRIRKFAADTPDEVRLALAKLSPGSALTLDLRGCDGGELEPAIELASLFMEPGEKVVTLRERGKKDDVRTAAGPREVRAPALILLQDEGTASAAEVLIAALVGSPSNRAASQGTKTYGKGVYQIAFDLLGGGMLKLTVGELIAPQGRTWEGTGLLPSLGNRRGIFGDL